jgi:hypothetical protein
MGLAVNSAISDDRWSALSLKQQENAVTESSVLIPEAPLLLNCIPAV